MKSRFYFFSCRAFTLVEVLVSVAVIAVLLLLFNAFIFQFVEVNTRTKTEREVAENAEKIMSMLSYEIREAESIYTPTTTSRQLSLETKRYLPVDETVTFIDFFLCGTQICIKKEGSGPEAVTSSEVQVSELAFSKVSVGQIPSIKIHLTFQNAFPVSNSGTPFSLSIDSTVAPRP